MDTWTLTQSRWSRRLLVAAALGLALPSTGRAFYFDYGPGSGSPPPKSLVPVEVTSTTQTQIKNQEFNWVDYGEPGENHAPEPASGVAAMIGLGSMGLARWRRRR
jgi:hypothetical protein